MCLRLYLINTKARRFPTVLLLFVQNVESFMRKAFRHFVGVCIYEKMSSHFCLPSELSQAAHFNMWQWEFFLNENATHIKKFRNSHRILDSLCNVAQLPNFLFFFFSSTNPGMPQSFTVSLSLTHIATIHSS